MEYPVRFARSDDGTAIASWRQGTGPPLVVATLAGGIWPPSTIVSNAGARLFYDLLSRRHMIIAYDARGMGLSQRDVTNYSLGASSDDLRAVADLWELDQFALLGFRGPAKTAVQFAATHPERVSRMVLRDPILGQGDHPLQQREKRIARVVRDGLRLLPRCDVAFTGRVGNGAEPGGGSAGRNIARDARGGAAGGRQGERVASGAGRRLPDARRAQSYAAHPHAPARVSGRRRTPAGGSDSRARASR